MASNTTPQKSLLNKKEQAILTNSRTGLLTTSTVRDRCDYYIHKKVSEQTLPLKDTITQLTKGVKTYLTLVDFSIRGNIPKEVGGQFYEMVNGNLSYFGKYVGFQRSPDGLDSLHQGGDDNGSSHYFITLQPNSYGSYNTTSGDKLYKLPSTPDALTRGGGQKVPQENAQKVPQENPQKVKTRHSLYECRVSLLPRKSKTCRNSNPSPITGSTIFGANIIWCVHSARGKTWLQPNRRYGKSRGSTPSRNGPTKSNHCRERSI